VNRHESQITRFAKPFLGVRRNAALLIVALIGLLASVGTAQAQVSCPEFANGVTMIANATSKTCSSSASTVAPSVSILNNVSGGFQISITPNTGAAAPVSATCTGGGCFIPPSGGTINCDATSQPCAVGYSFPDANGDTVSGSFNVPAYFAAGPIISAHSVSGGVFNETTPPTVTSITRGFAGAGQIPETTDSDLISWFVKFSEDITRPYPSDFTVSGTTASISVSHVNNDEYEISLSGGDIATVNGTVTLNFAGGQTITDTAGNALVNVTPSGANDNSFNMVNNTAPAAPSGLMVTNIVNPNPTNAAQSLLSLAWTVSADDGGAAITQQDITIYADAACMTDVFTGAIGLPTATSANVGLDLTAFSVGAKPSFSIQAVNSVGSSAPSNCVSTTIPSADTTAPTFTTVSIASNNADSEWAKSGDVITLTLQADEPLAAAPTVTIAGQAATVTGGGANWSATTIVTGATAEGQAAINISAFEDANGNAGTAVTATTDMSAVTVDVTRPRISSWVRQSPTDEFTNADTLTWLWTSSEPILNFTADDVRLSGTTALLTIVSVSETVFDVTASGGDLATVGGSSGLAALRLSLNFGSGITDKAGNLLTDQNPTGSEEGYEVSNYLPEVKRVSRTGAENTSNDTLSWGIVLRSHDNDIALTADDLILTGTTATINVVKLFGTTFEISISGGDLADLDGVVTVAVKPGLTDKFGNVLVSSTPTDFNDNNYNVSNSQPTVNITAPNGNLVNGAFPITITFNRPVTGFGVWNISVTNGDASNFVAVSASEYTATVTPNTDGQVEIVLPEGAARDGASNRSQEARLVLNSDATAPRVTSIKRKTPLSENTNADSLLWEVTFSEPVGWVRVDDFALTGTTADLTYLSINGTNDVYVFEASGGDLPDLVGVVGLTLAPGATIEDDAGNALTNLTPTGISETFAVDNRAPTLVSILLDGGTVSPTDADTLSFLFTYSEDLDPSSLDVSNGLVTGTTANVTLTPLSASVARVTLSGGDLANLNGPVTVSLNPTNNIADPAGNLLRSVTPTGTNNNTVVVQNDATAPTVTITSDATNPVSGAFTVTVTFSEDVTGFELADITVGNGTASNFKGASLGLGSEQSRARRIGARVYSALITPTADGPVTVDVAANAAQDSAGNDNLAASQFSITNDTSSPSASVSTPPSSVSGPFDLTFSFTEDMNGLTADDFVVTNGTVVLTGGPRDFIVTITPDGNGDISVALPANVATDLAGNGNQAFNAVFQIEFDAIVPTVSTSTPPASVNGPFDLTFSFTEDMSGLTASDFNVVNGTVAISGGPRAFIVTITPDENGDISISLPANAATDAAGNGNEALETPIQVTFDAAPPTVSVSAAPASVNGPLDLTFSFTEDVTGLTASDFAVENATIVLSGGPRDFIVTITPDGTGDVSINLPANVATDPAGNGNLAFNAVIEVSFDVVAPSVALSTVSAEVTGPFTITVTFSEAVTGFTADDITVENGTLSDFSGSDSVYTAIITPLTIGDIIMTIADGAATDLAGNSATGHTLNATAGGGEAIVELEVTMSVLDSSSVGTEFTLSNPGSQSIFFIASSDQIWVDVTPGSGKIDSLSNIEFNIQLNDAIDDLAPGTYVATVTVEVVDEPAASAGRTVTSNAVTRNILAEVPITVEVEERFGSFELVVLTPTGPATGGSFDYVSSVAALNGLSVPANVGERRTTLSDLLQGAYTLEQSVPDGYHLSSITCSGDRDGGTVVDVEAATVNIDLDASESISCVFENARDDDVIRIATQRAIRNFMARRGDRVLSATPDLSKRFANRRRKEGGQFSASGTDLRTNMDFETSLSGFRNRAVDNETGAWNDLSSPEPSKWDLWASAEYTRYEDERADSGVDGKFFAAQFGADYLLKPNLIVGAMVQYDWMSELDKEPVAGLGTQVGADARGDGVMAGPYIVWQPKEQLTIDVVGLWGGSENTVNPLGYYSDQFETNRFLVRANVTGEFASGPWRLRPQMSLSHYQDKQHDYVDSLGINIPSQTVTIGRLRAGPEMVWTHQTEGGSQIEIGGSIRGVWNYNGAGLMDQSGLISSGSDPIRADGDLSIGTRLANGIKLRATVGFDGIGQGDFSARTGRLEFVFPFGRKGGDVSTLATNPLQQAGFHRACETDGFLQSMNRAVPTACHTAPRANLLDTNIAMMAAR